MHPNHTELFILIIITFFTLVKLYKNKIYYKCKKLGAATKIAGLTNIANKK